MKSRKSSLGSKGILALLLLVASPSLATGGLNGPDDIGSTPRLMANTKSTGFVLTVDESEIIDLLDGTRVLGESSSLTMTPQEDGTVRFEYAGAFRIRVDAEKVATGAIQVDYLGARHDASYRVRHGQLVLFQR